MPKIGLGVGITAQRGGLGDSGEINAPFDSVNGATQGPSAGPYDSWSVQYASQPTITDPVAFTVSREGYDDAGDVTEYLDTFYVTKAVRQPYPNHASQSALTAALSDYIYSTDTPSGGVTNNSSLTSPKPICGWITPHRSVVGNTIGGSTVLVEITAWHRNARARRQVACVIFSITDGTNTITCTPVSTTVVSGRAGDQNAVLAYRMPETDITSLNAGVITIRAKVYPWIGAASSVVDSNDGTAITGRDFGPRYFYKDTSLAASPYYATLATAADAPNGIGTPTASGVFSTTAATADATPFDTVANLFTALNSGAAGRADGVIVRACAGTFVLTGSGVSRNQDCAAMIFTRHPSATKTTAIYSFGLGAFRPRLLTGLDSPLTTGCIRFTDCTLLRTGTLTFTGESANRLEIQFDNIDLDNAGHNATWLSQAHDYLYGVTITNLNVSSPLNAGTYEHRCFRGVLWTPTASTSLEAWLVVGCTVSGPFTLVYGTRTADGSIIAFNKMKNPLNSSTQLSFGGSEDIFGFAIGQNVFEYTAGGTVSATLRISGDSAANNTSHVVIHNNTYIGAFEAGRWNSFYDEGPTPRTHKLQSVVGNIISALYTKSDIFRGANEGGGDASTRLGNWGFMYGVGCFDNWSQYRSADDLGGAQAQAYGGLGSSIGTSQSTPQMATSNFTSYAGTTVSAGPTYTSGAGDGTYTLVDGAPVEALLDVAVLSHDLAGTARPLEDDAIGAYAAAA